MRIDIIVSDGGIDEVVGTVRIVPNDAPDTGDALNAIRDAMCELADLAQCSACDVLAKHALGQVIGNDFLCHDCGGNPEAERQADLDKMGDQAFDRQREERP